MICSTWSPLATALLLVTACGTGGEPSTQGDRAPHRDLRLDLRDLEMVESAEVAVSEGAGQIAVLLPPSVPVGIMASSGAGEVDLLGESSEGLSLSRTYKSESYETADVRLSMVIDVTAGAIEVKR